jgi:hypothetical protein
LGGRLDVNSERKSFDYLGALRVRIGAQMQLDVVLQSDGREPSFYSRFFDHNSRLHSIQIGELLRGQEQPDEASLARRSLDALSLLQTQDHLMYRRRGDLEIALYIRLGRSLTVELGVVENVRKLLPLLWRVP